MHTISCQEFPLLSCFFLLKYFTQHKPYSLKCVSLKLCFQKKGMRFRGNILSLHRCFVEFGPQYSQKAPQCVQLPQKHPTSHLLSPLMISYTTLTQNFTLTPVSTYLLLCTGTLNLEPQKCSLTLMALSIPIKTVPEYDEINKAKIL